MSNLILTNIPTPYRNAVFERLPREKFVVVFCARNEPNRSWTLEEPRFDHIFLKERFLRLRDGFNFHHINLDVWSVLQRQRPSVVVLNGLNVTHLLAFVWACLHGARIVYHTDGTVTSEAGLTRIHRLLRKLVIGRSAAGVVASKGGRELLGQYGLSADRVFFSRLCADNERFAAHAQDARTYDVMFAGRLHELKLPDLFVEVCLALVKRRGRCRALVVGDGPLREQVISALEAGQVEVTSTGFVQSDGLPPLYGSARLLLFPTRQDAWGVVANEAMAAGTPVLTTPAAGVAHDLVIDGVTGRVLPAETSAWVAACETLLEDQDAWARMSEAARRHVQQYNYEAAAQGFVQACQAAAG